MKRERASSWPASRQHLQRWSTHALKNTGEATIFKYAPLAERCIRLLRLVGLDRTNKIYCSLSHVSLDAALDYDAISYAWNGETPTVPTICNGQKLFITPSLHEALQTLDVKGHRHPLWADAVCIDQSDDEEKSAQVQMMDTIYSTASTVIVWLGPPSNDSGLAMEKLDWLTDRLDRIGSEIFADYPQTLRRHGIPVDDPLWRSIAGLLSRRWFKRLWTTQEVALARNCILCCGPSFAKWDVFLGLIMRILGRGFAYLINPTQDPSNLRRTGSYNIEYQVYIAANWQQGRHTPMNHLMDYARTRETSNPLDRVYAILGLVDPVIRKQIKIDYSSENRQRYWHVYIALGHILLADSPELELLREAESETKPRSIPSWCPNFDAARRSFGFPLKYYSAGGLVTQARHLPHVATSLNRKSIIIRGVQADGICEVGDLSWPKFDKRDAEEVLRERLVFLNECKRMSYKALGISSSTVLTENDDIPDALIRTLIGNQVDRGNTYAPDQSFFDRMSHNLQKYFFAGSEHGKPGGLSMSDGEWIRLRKYRIAMNSVCMARRFFTTSNGLVGMGPQSTQPGDIVCVFRGSPVPFVLRVQKTNPQDQEIFQLVGETYVHGIMDGETFQAEEEGEEVAQRLFTVA